MRGLWRSGLRSACRSAGENNRILFSARRFISRQGAACLASDPEQEFAQLRENITLQPGKSLDLLESWRTRGNTLTLEKLSDVFNHLAKLKRGKEALKINSHVRKLKLVPFSTELCIRELTMASLIYHELGVQRSYEEFPEELKTEEVTAALINNLVKNKALIKAQLWVKKVLKKMKLPESFNAVMSFYFAKEMHEHVRAVYSKMKRSSSAKPTAETFFYLLRSKKRAGGFETIEEEAREALKDVDVENLTDKVLLTYMLEVFGHLGDAERVGLVWERLNALCSTPGSMFLDSYDAAFTAFHLVGLKNKAREIAEEMVKYKRMRTSPYYDLVDMYARLGMIKKAEEVIREKEEAKKVFSNSLVLHYLRSEQAEKALEMLESTPEKGTVSLMSYELVVELLEYCAAEEDFNRASKMMNKYICLRHGDSFLYNKLLEVYIAAGKKPDKLVKDEFPFLVPNERTLLLLMEAEFRGK